MRKMGGLLSGTEGVALLDAREYKILSNYLDLLRNDGSREAHALAWALQGMDAECRTNPKRLLPRFLRRLMTGLGEDCEEVRAVVCNTWEDQPLLLVHERGEREYQAIHCLINLLRSGGWFAAFISRQLERYKEGATHVTPSEVIGQLSGYAARFERRIKNTKRLIRQHPELLGVPPSDRDAGKELQEEAPHASTPKR